MIPLDNPIQSPDLFKAFQLMQKEKWEESQKLLEKGLKAAETSKDKVLMGVFLSTLGFLFKKKKEFRFALKYYEKAEKIIPDDPSLKIITARLLADHFNQHDTVIRKIKKLIEEHPKDFILLHQAYTLLGFSYFKKGKKSEAHDCLKKSMGDQFKGLQTMANLDFKLVELMIQKKFEVKSCHDFLEKSRQYAIKTKEKQYVVMIDHLLKLFPSL